MADKEKVPVHRQIRECLRHGVLTPEDAQLLRDAIIDTRDTLVNIVPAADFILEQADRKVDDMRWEYRSLGYNPNDVDGGGCVSAALIGALGADIVPPSDPIVHLWADQVEVFNDLLATALGARGLTADFPTTSAQFVAQMTAPGAVGAIIGQEISSRIGHVIGIRPVVTAAPKGQQPVPFTSWDQILTEQPMEFNNILAVTDIRFPEPPCTKFCSYENLPNLFATSLREEVNGSDVSVFRRRTEDDLS